MYSLFKERVYNLISHFVKKAYAVGYRFNDDNSEFKYCEEIPFSILMPIKKEWYADPFPFIWRGEHYIFVEIMKEENNKRGTLGYTCLERDNGEFHEILSEPFHLSYPNVFEFKEKIYMIPETNQANQLRIYEAVSFPNKWELKKVLLEEICCVDTSIYFDTQDVFLETYDQIREKNRLFRLNEKFNLYEIETENSVFVDRRPGGNFIQYDTGLYHALQNCDGSYGKWLHIAKVDSFSLDGLYEREIGTYKLKNVKHDAKGVFNRIHTFNRTENFEVIDLHLYQLKFEIEKKEIEKGFRCYKRGSK
ncbi:MAG: hypothetical protein V8S08_08015 [Lachnoclostridium sp.]